MQMGSSAQGLPLLSIGVVTPYFSGLKNIPRVNEISCLALSTRPSPALLVSGGMWKEMVQLTLKEIIF